MRRCRFYLELDPSTAGRFYCGSDEGPYAVLVRTLIPHDPGCTRTHAVFSRFRDLLRQELTGGTERLEREQIARACESLVAPGELMHERPDDLLTFTILRPYGEECRVYSLAAERVLLIRGGEWQEPIIPASAAAALEERGIDRKSALSAAGIIQEAVRVGSDVARHMRSATVPARAAIGCSSRRSQRRS